MKDEEGEEPERSATHWGLPLPLSVTMMESPGEKAPVVPQGMKAEGEDALANLTVRAVLLTAGCDMIVVPATKGREQALCSTILLA